jgi:hypothetical protein
MSNPVKDITSSLAGMTPASAEEIAASRLRLVEAELEKAIELLRIVAGWEMSTLPLKWEREIDAFLAAHRKDKT